MDVDDLYGLPLDQFIPERTALARELRKAGEREAAAEVAGLRKPSVAAWAVNQLVRSQVRAVAELFESGDGLRSAQEDVLAGRGDSRSLRAAVERERLAEQKLTDAAQGLLSSEGHELSDTMIERVSDTLHAAALDDEAREQVSGGRLERELRHVGLGMAAFAAGSPAPRVEKGPAQRAEKRPARRAEKQSETRKTDSDEKIKKQAGELAAQERTAREQAKAQEEARRAARVTEREARRRAERAGRGAKLALERRDKAAEALREAEAELEAAEAEVHAAEEALREAEAAARKARR